MHFSFFFRNICREEGNLEGEARALYNLGNVLHAKGKHDGRNNTHDPGHFPLEVKESLTRAAKYYEYVVTPGLSITNSRV